MATKSASKKEVPRFEYQAADHVHTYSFLDAPISDVSIMIEKPEYDRFWRLMATVTAHMGDITANSASLNLLDQHQRVDFERVAGELDGAVPWHVYLLLIVPHLRKQLSTFGTFVTASPIGSPVFADLQPLPDPLPKVEPFEPKLLPEAFRPWIEDISARMQCPMDFPTVSIMVAIASVVGRRVVIRPKKQDDWRVVANLWGGVVGRPGVLKTPAIQEPLRPLYRLEYDADLTYKDLVDQWKVQQVLAKEQEKVSSQQIREILKKGLDATSIAETMVAADHQ